MAKPLSDRMISALRMIAMRDGDGIVLRDARTRNALLSRFMIKGAHGDADRPMTYVLTPSGRHALDEIECAERAKVAEAERAARPVPAGACVEPSASVVPVMGLEYDEEEPEPSAPAVRLTEPAEPGKRFRAVYSGELREVPDSDVLQLLALLDSGARITRRLFGGWEIRTGPDVPFSWDAMKADRAARAAVYYGLATQQEIPNSATAQDWFVLRPEPIHLEAPDRKAQETVCGRRMARASHHRIRYTTDPDKATHDRCRLPKVGERARFRRTGSTTGHVYEISEIADGMARIWWDNAPEDYPEEIRPRWVSWHALERVTD